MRDRSDPPPSEPTPARAISDPDCPECGQSRTAGHVCTPKVVTG
jgi:hypothetical protein